MLEQLYFLTEDLKRWKIKSIKGLFYAFFEQGILATILYRLRRMLFFINIPILKTIIRFGTFLIFKFTEIFLGVTIRSETEIGPGLYIGHTGVTRIHPKVKIGKNFTIGPCSTIGQRAAGYDESVPVIGDNVYVGAGAKVLGAIKIGNNVNIGANAVVITDIPDNATAVGIPAKVVKIRDIKSIKKSQNINMQTKISNNIEPIKK